MDDPLVTVADIMTPTTACAAAHDTVAAVAEIFRRHQLPGLPVTQGDRVVGIVTPLHLLREPAYRPVAEVMVRDITPATPDLTLLQAHALMTRQGVEVLPVVEHDRIIGQLGLIALLRAHTQQTDPLTGLPWAAALRTWAAAALTRGHEIAIVFIDLDNFGAVNKALGHVVGDDILRSVTHLLASLIDVSTDLLCRYGGDEFAIATTRRHEEARALAERIQATVVLPVEIDDTRRQIRCSVGFAGGRRVEGRAPAHIAATIEDLLTLASRASTAAKEAAERAVRRTERTEAQAVPQALPSSPAAGTPAAPAPGRGEAPGAQPAEARLRLTDVLVYAGPAGCTASVTLQLGEREGTGRASGPMYGPGVSFLVAQATLSAVVQTVGEEHAYVLEDLREVPSEFDRMITTVLASAAGRAGRFVGGARAPDLPHAVARAILDALNRVLARPLGEMLRREPSP
jgi:IMP dehydrogenase